MIFTIRNMTASDRAAWMDMRSSLWPGDSPFELACGIKAILAAEDAWGFIAETIEGRPAAFAELSIRKQANGCQSTPVPFLEAIFVRPEFRLQGAGARLIAHIEAFVISRGFLELGSDALIDNHGSHAAHRGWGFHETERVVYFRKVLGNLDA
jgi:aminoglycoside 6'-N-acetyltransferase I